MASILLIHVASDKDEAKRLVDLLKGAGHRVVSADPDGPDLQGTDAVVVIWSSAAITSPFVYERARLALSADHLVQVTAADLQTDQLPPVFRVHPHIPISSSVTTFLDEVEDVLSLRESTYEWLLSIKEHDRHQEPLSPDQKPSAPQGPHDEKSLPLREHAKLPASEPAPPVQRLGDETPDKPESLDALANVLSRPVHGFALALGSADRIECHSIPPPIPAHLKCAALERVAGQLNHRIPSAMHIGRTELVEVRLGRAHQDLSIGLIGSGDLAVEDLPIIETMTVDLVGSPGAFSILRQARRTQLVLRDRVWNERFDDHRFGRWIWAVTPKKTGSHDLLVKVSADMSDSRGVATSETYRDRSFSIKVRVNVAQVSMRTLKWTAAGAVSGVAGAYTQEVWWPKLKAMLVGAGLLT